MTPLLDVNLLLAYGWQSHPNHSECSKWLDSLDSFATCAITELGFLRISMSPAFRATNADSNKVLNFMTSKDGAFFIPCDIAVETIPSVSRYKDTTDAYLVALASHHSLGLATLDQGILSASWAAGIAFDPLNP